MVYGRYNELVNGVYKPTYNWGAPSCKEPQNNDTTIPYRFPPVASPREPWDFPLKKQHHRRGKSMVFTMVFTDKFKGLSMAFLLYRVCCQLVWCFSLATDDS